MIVTSFECKKFDELSLTELYEVLCLRDEVFVVGQKITAVPEVDGADPGFHHILGREASGLLVATARLSLDAQVVRVGRIAVRDQLQGRGIGTALMREIQRILGSRSAEMNAQAHLEPWYAGLGWQRNGPVFFEAEIEHVRMIWTPS